MSIEYPPITSKIKFVEEYRKGTFGNASPTWEGLSDWIEDVWKDRTRDNALYHIRNRVAGAKTWYDIPHTFVPSVWNKAIETFPPESLYISEMAPTDKTIIQGEVMRTPRGLYFFYSRVRKPMREALKEDGRQSVGILAASLLRHFLNPVSYDWLQTLLDRYPDHVIEISAYDREWGTLPGYNTVYWEVRRY